MTLDGKVLSSRVIDLSSGLGNEVCWDCQWYFDFRTAIGQGIQIVGVIFFFFFFFFPRWEDIDSRVVAMCVGRCGRGEDHRNDNLILECICISESIDQNRNGGGVLGGIRRKEKRNWVGDSLGRLAEIKNLCERSG